MASWTAPTTHATGDDFSVSDWNAAAGDLTFLYQRPYATAYSAGGTSIGGSPTQVTLGSFYVNGYGYTLSSNNIILPLTGAYSVSGQVQCTQASGTLLGFIYLNGSNTVNGRTTVDTTGVSTAAIPPMCITASSGATLGLVAECTSSTGTVVAGPAVTFLSVFFLGST